MLEMFNPFLDVVLGPLLHMDPLWAVLLVTLIVSLFITLVQKLTTNQTLMKQLKDEIKELQSEAKELRDNPEAMMRVQNKMMETNMKYMGQSMRSTFFTMIPIILLFGWMSAHFAYMPLYVGSEFVVGGDFSSGDVVSLVLPEGLSTADNLNQTIGGGRASWKIRGDVAGEYNVGFAFKDKVYSLPVLISAGERKYAKDSKNIDDNGFESAFITYEKLRVLPIWPRWGWLGTYIIGSILFSMLFRNLFKVY